MLVFAVAVLIVQHVCGSVRLVAPYSQRETYIAEILGHEIVKGFGFFQIRVEPLDQFLGLSADFRGRRSPVLLQARVPAANLLPGFKGGELNVGPIVFGTVLFFFLFFLGLVFVLPLEMRTGPAVDAAAILFGDFRFHPRLVLQLQRAVGGHVHIQGFIEHNVVLVEYIVGPELAGSQRSVDHRDQVVFQHFPRPQSGHGDVLLPVIGVDRSVVLDGGAQILHGIVAGLDHGAVRLEDSHVRNLNPLVGRVIPHLKLSPLLQARLTLHPDSG